jgi:hypothetical protein
LSLQRHEGPDLEALLDDVRNRWGEAATIVEANRIRRGGVAGFFARERFEVVVDPGGVDDDSPALEERLLGLADDVSDDESGSFLVDAPSEVSTERPSFTAVLASITDHVDAPSPPAVPETPGDASGPELPGARGVPEMPGARGVPEMIDEAALVRVGLPDDLLRPAPMTGDASRWLLGLLEHVPRPDRLPQGRGAVIATVGPRHTALALARQLAAELGLAGDAVVLASPDYRGRAVPVDRRVATPELAAEQRRSWRRRPHPTVVAVESIPGRPAQWTHEMLDALEPTMIWGAVEAIRKPEDLNQWAEEVGGFDALAVTGLDDTVSPAAVLRCGIPVGRLDGRQATPALWAALLAERVVA